MLIKLLILTIINVLLIFKLRQKEFTYENYIDPYLYTNIATKEDIIQEYVVINEPIFPLFLYLVGLLNLSNINTYFLIQFIGFTLLSVLSINKSDTLLVNTIKYICILAVPSVFILSTNLWRQYFSLLFATYAIFYFDQKKYLKWFVFFISFLIHFSSFIIVISYVICQIKNIKLKLILSVLLCFLIYSTSEQLITLSYLNIYIESEEPNIYRRIYFLFLISVMVVMLNKSNYDKICILIIISIIVFCFNNETLFGRLSHISIFIVSVIFFKLQNIIKNWLTTGFIISINLIAMSNSNTFLILLQ